MMLLRELRIWHWLEALKASKSLHSRLGSRSSRQRAQKLWNLHMGAVQCLNDYLPDTTAETDLAEREKRGGNCR